MFRYNTHPCVTVQVCSTTCYFLGPPIQVLMSRYNQHPVNVQGTPIHVLLSRYTHLRVSVLVHPSSCYCPGVHLPAYYCRVQKTCTTPFSIDTARVCYRLGTPTHMLLYQSVMLTTGTITQSLRPSVPRPHSTHTMSLHLLPVLLYFPPFVHGSHITSVYEAYFVDYKYGYTEGEQSQGDLE